MFKHFSVCISIMLQHFSLCAFLLYSSTVYVHFYSVPALFECALKWLLNHFFLLCGGGGLHQGNEIFIILQRCDEQMECHTGNVRDIFTNEQFFCSIFLGCILIYALRMQRCKAMNLALMCWCSWDKPLMPFSESESTYLLCAKYPP